MKTFKQHLHEETQSTRNLLELIEFMEMDEDILNETVDIKGALKKANVFVKDNRGLLATVARAGKNIGQLFFHTMKAFTGNEASATKVREIANKKVTQKDFINFLINLDMVTLHAISGPMHALEAVTGWPIHHALTKLHDKTKDFTEKALKALDDVKTAIGNLNPRVRKKANVFVTKLQKTFKKE